MKIVSYSQAGSNIAAGSAPATPFAAFTPAADSFTRGAAQPHFGMWAPGGLLADWLDMVTLSGGVDMTLNYTGQAIARNFAIKVRSLPQDQRLDVVRHMIRRKGMIKVWTATTVMDLISENLSGKNQLEAAKDAVRWYYHYGNNYNFFLAVKMADRMQGDDKFRKFMEDFYREVIEPTPDAEEKSLPMKILTERQGLLGGYSLTQWAWAYPVLEAGEWLFDKTFGLTDANRHEAIEEAVGDLPREFRKAAKSNSSLDVEQLERLKEHLKKQLTIRVDDDFDYPDEIDAKAKAVFRQWVEEHPVGAPSREDRVYEATERKLLEKLTSGKDQALTQRIWEALRETALNDETFLDALAARINGGPQTPTKRNIKKMKSEGRKKPDHKDGGSLSLPSGMS